MTGYLAPSIGAFARYRHISGRTRDSVSKSEEGQMTIIVGVLVAVAVVALAVWWLFDFDMPEVVIPVAAPGVGAALIYWYGTPLAWAAGIALLVVAGAAAFYLIRRAGGGTTEPPK